MGRLNCADKIETKDEKKRIPFHMRELIEVANIPRNIHAEHQTERVLARMKA